MADDPDFVFPSKTFGYLKRLRLAYASDAASLHHKLVSECKFYVREGTEYDNWNGGTYGHDLVFFGGIALFEGISIDEQEAARARIHEDINKLCSGISNEFVSSVIIDFEDNNDAEFQEARQVDDNPPIAHEQYDFWVGENIRVFISHRDNQKELVHQLANSLEAYGLSCFVAHDTIEPTTEWLKEIVKALETMEIMLCFVTDDFHESTWTNQEVGYALGKRIPVISLKMQNKDPSGFVGEQQAMRCSLDDPTVSSKDIFDLVAKKMGYGGRIKSALINAFCGSTSFRGAETSFQRLSRVTATLNDIDIAKIIDGFNTNEQISYSWGLREGADVVAFLEKNSGRKFEVEDRKISEKSEMAALDEDIPF